MGELVADLLEQPLRSGEVPRVVLSASGAHCFFISVGPALRFGERVEAFPDFDRLVFPLHAHAVREAKIAARNIAATFGIGEKRPFRYRTMGQLALVGERTGVADVMGHQFSGFIAWFMWRTYYLLRIPMLEKRLRVVMDWTLDLFFERDLVQLAVVRERKPVARAKLTA